MEVNDQRYELIIKELTSEISDQEKQILDSELSSSLEFRRKKDILHTFWFNYFPKPLPNQIIRKTEKKLGLTIQPKHVLSFGFFYKVAATILLAISLGYIAYLQYIPETSVTLNEYVVLPGEVKEFVLSDGTKVWLNSKTVLIASEPFVDENREVLLIGEGYFEVAHDAEKPFVIKTSSLKTTVLGTHLNVSAYPGDIKTEVSLYEGKVELSEKNMPENKLVMKPGQKVSFTNDENNFYLKQNDLEKPAEWREGILRFYDEDLNSISQKLERKFMTKIFITDEEVGKLRFTASFDTEPVDKILSLLSEAQEFKTEKTINGIIIKSFKKQHIATKSNSST
ncbi:MAG TPA: FecR domain-containing protein [Draconibacterium sp.]|nr:FecR domain-containing protein [Draconibacterium sp.]